MFTIFKNKITLITSVFIAFIFLFSLVKDNAYAQAVQTTYTEAQVLQHATQTDCWIIISGKVYDVTNFIPLHPGGRSRIINQCGYDATVPFDTQGGSGSHSSRAYSLLNTYYIGDLGNGTTVPTVPVVTVNATQSTIVSGQSTSINWSSTNATTCVRSGTSIGTAGTFTTGALTQSTSYTISCTGAGGTSAASITVAVTQPVPVPVVGVCGASNGLSFTAAPSTNLCSSGASAGVSGQGPWSWTCAGSNGGTSATCGANKTLPVINGSCGSSNGQSFTQAPNTNLCSTGTAASITGQGPWSWTCAGSNGGASVSCSASLTAPADPPVDGVCGSSSGHAFTSVPTSGLCGSGVVSAILGQGPWSWTCTGSNGGATPNCGASLDTTTPTPTTTPPIAMCSYAVPPQGCTYTQGPNYVPTTGCGMVLSCPNTSTTSVTTTYTTLTKGEIITVPTMTKGTQIKYTFTIPENTKNLTIKTTGATGDADIFLSKLKSDSRKSSTWRSTKTHSNELIKLESPRTGTYYLTLYAYSDTTATTVLMDYTLKPSTGSSTVPSGIFCTQEMYTCANGISVRRTGPNCKFICPSSTSSREIEHESEDERERR